MRSSVSLIIDRLTTMPISSMTAVARLLRITALAALASTIGSAPASAQFATSGTTTVLRSGVVRGVDAAFDPSTNTYMVVGAQDSVFAVCTNAAGAATTAVITIKPPNGNSSNKPFGSFPRVRYSQDLNGGAGAFMVIWQQEEVTGAPQLHARVVSCSAGLLGTDQVISGSSPPWTDFGASSFAYSPTSQKFLVAWKAWLSWRMVARLMDLNGAGVGEVVTLSTEFGRDPGVAWNPTLNEFGVSYSGEAANGRDGYSVFVRMPADNIASFARTTFNSVPGCLTTTTDLVFNPDTQRYVMTWWQGCGTATKVAEFDGAGTLQTIGLVSSTLGSYDALSLAYNPVSMTFALSASTRRRPRHGHRVEQPRLPVQPIRVEPVVRPLIRYRGHLARERQEMAGRAQHGQLREDWEPDSDDHFERRRSRFPSAARRIVRSPEPDQPERGPQTANFTVSDARSGGEPDRAGGAAPRPIPDQRDEPAAGGTELRRHHGRRMRVDRDDGGLLGAHHGGRERHGLRPSATRSTRTRDPPDQPRSRPGGQPIR